MHNHEDMISVHVCSIDLAPSEGRNIFVSGVSEKSSNFFLYNLYNLGFSVFP